MNCDGGELLVFGNTEILFTEQVDDDGGRVELPDGDDAVVNGIEFCNLEIVAVRLGGLN